MSIQLRHVSKCFDDYQALDDVSIDVPAGSLTALLGPSGGGKSTLLRIIAGLELADTGEVLIDGHDMSAIPARKRGIGFVFQHYAAFPHMTVWQNIAFGLQVAKVSKPKVRQRVDEMVELVHLSGFANRYPNELSGGQRQRMALARALAVQPRFLLLDEPFGAVDSRVRHELRIWLRNLHDQVKATTVFVTHDQEEALELSDEIVVVNGGRVEQVGSPQEIYDSPSNDFVMEFMGPVTHFGERVIRPHEIELDIKQNKQSVPATINRIVSLGFYSRVELSLDDGSPVIAQIIRQQVKDTHLSAGQRVFIRDRLASQRVPLPPPPAQRHEPHLVDSDLPPGNETHKGRQ